MNRDQLLELLENFSIPVFQRDTPNGGTMVVTQRGARVLGLFPRCEGTNNNVLWINPGIEAILHEKAVDWEGCGAGSVGGDRLWLSPERNFYYRSPANFQEWFTPLQMDPGHYEEIEAGENSVSYENRFDVVDQLTGAVYRDVCMRRTIALLDRPAAMHAEIGTRGGVGYVGVESRELLEISASSASPPAVCPWGLTQVPVPSGGQSGTVIIPTARRATPIGYFGEIPANRLRVAADHVSFRIDARQVAKLGILAEDVAPSGPVRIACLAPAIVSSRADSAHDKAGDWVLLVKESTDVARDSAFAVDPAKADPDGPRGVVQSYNSGPDGAQECYPRFGEIEMQYNPVQSDGNGVFRSTVTSRLMAFQGSREAMESIARETLRIASPDLFLD